MCNLLTGQHCLIAADRSRDMGYGWLHTSWPITYVCCGHQQLYNTAAATRLARGDMKRTKLAIFVAAP